jgi:glycine C-acetyltransferase
VGAALAALEVLESYPELRLQLLENTAFMREGLKKLGFEVVEGETAIIPVLVRDTQKAQQMNQLLFEEGVFVQGFWFPVVPKGQERLRVQVSASHTKKDLEEALGIFGKVKNKIERSS